MRSGGALIPAGPKCNPGPCACHWRFQRSLRATTTYCRTAPFFAKRTFDLNALCPFQPFSARGLTSPHATACPRTQVRSQRQRRDEEACAVELTLALSAGRWSACFQVKISQERSVRGLGRPSSGREHLVLRNNYLRMFFPTASMTSRSTPSAIPPGRRRTQGPSRRRNRSSICQFMPASRK